MGMGRSGGGWGGVGGMVTGGKEGERREVRAEGVGDGGEGKDKTGERWRTDTYIVSYIFQVYIYTVYNSVAFVCFFITKFLHHFWMKCA